MSDGIEVRIKLSPELHKKWSHAASLRGLSLTGFVVSTVSGVLIHTGELIVTSVTATKTPPKAAPISTPKPRTPSEDRWADVVTDWTDDDDE